MTHDEAKLLAPGLYRIYWTDGECSLGAVGVMMDGSRWLFCTEWTTGSADSLTGCWIWSEATKQWNTVVRCELVMSNSFSGHPRLVDHLRSVEAINRMIASESVGEARAIGHAALSRMGKSFKFATGSVFVDVGSLAVVSWTVHSGAL